MAEEGRAMEMSKTKVIAARQSHVWAGLLDPQVLMACIPGCTEFTGSPEEGFKATVVQKVGPVKATFRGTVRLSEIDAPNGVRLEGDGNGGPAGFCRGGANVRLVPKNDSTEIAYDVDAKIGGKLAQLGSRVIDSFARKMADRFFENFQKEIEVARITDVTAPAGSGERQPEPQAVPAQESPEGGSGTFPANRMNMTASSIYGR